LLGSVRGCRDAAVYASPMKRAAAFLAVLLAVSPAVARDDLGIVGQRPGLELAMRLGVAARLYHSGHPSDPGPSDDVRPDDGIVTALPVTLEAGIRVLPGLYLGGYGTYAPAHTNACPDGATCGAHVLRAGGTLRAQLVPPDETWRFWVGGSVGYEWASTRFSQSGVDRTLTYRGPDFTTFEIGADWKLASRLRLGPYTSTTLFSRYLHLDASREEDRPGDIRHPTLHVWIETGVRISF
jgi:hypothetical protein